MKILFRYDRKTVRLDLPESTVVYESHYPSALPDPSKALLRSVRRPAKSSSLKKALQEKKPGKVCIVVSDITRPVPYACFLPALIREIKSAGIAGKNIFLLIATGMHRPSTRKERIAMFGKSIALSVKIVDHRAEEPKDLVPLPGRSASGVRVQMNRHYIEADFRIITGLVEPHFMAGFSGGRKSLCPGLVSLSTLENFHGEPFLSDTKAGNANLKGNPLHREAESIARLAGCEFCVNVVLDSHRKAVCFFSGDLFRSHAKAVAFVRKYACPKVKKEADIVITGSGGYPLDATFYQCVKGIVSCLPAVKKSGVILSLGGCCEGVGSPEYAAVMKEFAGRWESFLKHIRKPGVFTKDQWTIQMQTRALAKIGEKNLRFSSHNLSGNRMSCLSVNGCAPGPGGMAGSLQRLFGSLYKKGMTVAAFPEGPYCAPVSA